MEILSYEQLEFEDEGDFVKTRFLKQFEFSLEKSIAGLQVVKKNTLRVKQARKFSQQLEAGLQNMTSKVTHKPVSYVFEEGGLPLIGTHYFGLIDRNTNIIELRPLSGCNENCSYCSVDEGPGSRKIRDFVVEKDYLVKEFNKLATFKGSTVEAHINAQGEPTLYAPLAALIKDLRKNPQVGIISMVTNASVLDEKEIDKLIDAGITRFNVSLNALDERKAKIIAGWGKYDIAVIKSRIKYMAKRCKVLIAPVYLPGLNDDQIVSLVRFSQEIGADIGIQNFLHYKRGRNPVKEMSEDDFSAKLKQWEKETGVRLKVSAEDYEIKATKPLPKPFRKGNTIEALIVCDGRYPKEKLAVAEGRVIMVPQCEKKGKVQLTLTRSKHNIFYGKIK